MSSVDLGDVHLNVEVAGAGKPLVLLPGFTESAELWADNAAALAGSFKVVAVDLLGHGKSDAHGDAARYRFERCVEDLAAVQDALDIGHAHWLGYSMGGRIALAFALTHPGRVDRLILESASPGIADAAERCSRGERDEALALSIESDGVAAFVDEWLRQPLFATQARLSPETRAAARAVRLANSPVGMANSLRGAGAGAQVSYWNRLPELAASTLLLVGEEDEKFRAIAHAMVARMPSAKVAVIPGAGHSTHLENPAEFRRRVIEFLTAEGNQPPAPGGQFDRQVGKEDL